jgi:hypothetical protein
LEFKARALSCLDSPLIWQVKFFSTIEAHFIRTSFDSEDATHVAVMAAK